MTRPVDGWTQTGRPVADVGTWIETTDLPPAFRKAVTAEYKAKVEEITARVLEQNTQDMMRWVENFDALTAQMDEVADAYDDLRERALDGRVTSAEYDKELVRLDARRQRLEARAAEPEKEADRIAKVADDPVAVYDELLVRYPALPRPEFSFVPVRGL